jgi:hypothetical protein
MRKRMTLGLLAAFVTRRRRAPLLLVAGLLAGSVLAVTAGPASAAVTPVNCPPYGSDDLQAKITAAAPGATLLIKGTCTGNFTVSQNLTLQGAGQDATLNGGGVGRTVSIVGPATVTVRSLTVTGGSAIGGVGGGIAAFGATLNLVNDTVRGNTVTYWGGGIFTYASTLTVTGSTVSGNTTLDQNGDGNGAGIYVLNSTATVTASTVTGNTATNLGAIVNDSGTLTITASRLTGNTNVALGNFGGTVTLTNSSVDHNTAQGGAGGIWNDSANQDATMTINNSTVADNIAQGAGGSGAYPFNGGGGIFNFSENGNTANLTATHMILTGNTAPASQGGGIQNFNLGGAGANVTVSQSLLSGNQSILGGAIYMDATSGPASVSLQPGTIIVHNQATIDGGGIYNTGGGVVSTAPGVVFLFNTPDNIS